MDNAYRSLSYTTRKRLKKDKISFRCLSLNPKSVNPQKFLPTLLKKGFPKPTKPIIWHDVSTKTVSKQKSKRDNPCDVDKLLEILTGLKKKIEAILYCQRLRSPNLFQQLKETGIFILDVKKQLKLTKKQNNPDFAADLAEIHPQSSTDIKLISTVLENKDYLRSLVTKKRSKSKNRPSQKKRKEAQRRLGSSLK